jgi:2-polyprenyl-3-methyl-5-hydroxy-6-metoxy-1,4-benzoquinol methylase
MRDDMKVSNHYAGRRGQKYVDEKQTDPFHPGYLIDFEYFKPYLDAKSVVLDFGCGNGGILRLIANHVARADGLEVNPAAAGKARGQGLTVFSSLTELPNEPTYDVIISNHVLEHVRDVCGTLERLRQSLQPAGIVVLKLPLDDARAAYQRKWTRNDSDHHLQTWTPRLLANVLFEAGFDVKQCRVITSAWHPKLFPLMKFGLGPFLFWLLAVARRRRQVFAVATKSA